MMDAHLFIDPPAKFRPWPLFVLNEDYDEDEGLERLFAGLEALQSVGYGGVFLHPRPGLITEYLSPRWFEIIEKLIMKCVQLGMIPVLYDENSYPSGCGGGHVCTRRPEVRSHYVKPVWGAGLPLPSGILALYARDGFGPGIPLTEAEAANRSWIAFCQGEAIVLDWHGQVPTPSLLDPLATATFLEVTHEAYWKNLSPDARAAVPAMFTDEPHLIADQHGTDGMGLPVTPYFRARFRQAHAYAIEDHFAELFFDVGNFREVRFDFYDFCHRLWKESWAEPLHQWHQEHGWKLTGHYLEHDWPVPYATPGQMELLAHMDWPGTDQLLGFSLEGHEFTDIQNFPPALPGREPHLLYYLRQASSVANQLGKERVLNECWGAGSNASTPADWLRIGHFLVVHGVNLLVPHHSMTSIRGTRKHDHPQFFSPQSPGFAYLQPLNDALGRLSYASSLGKAQNRVLVLDAQTTAFGLATKGNYSHPDARAQTSQERQGSLCALRENVVRFVESLSEAQIDFDIGDEYLIEENGQVKEGKLTLGQQAYEVIVWPQGLENLRSATVAKLEEFLEEGGLLLGVRPTAFTQDGRNVETLQLWEERFPRRVKWVTSVELVSQLMEQVPPRLSVEGSRRGLAHLRRVEKSNEIWLLVNSSPDERTVRLRQDGEEPLVEIDLETGFLHPTDAKTEAEARLAVGPWSARLLIAGPHTGGATVSSLIPQFQAEPQGVGTPLTPAEVRPDGPNVLVVDHCELILDGATAGTWNTRHANGLVWKRHALSRQGWSRTVQFRKQIEDRARSLGPDSGWEAVYSFEMAGEIDRNAMELAMETPELCRIWINDAELDFSGASMWLDPVIQKKRIGEHLMQGWNRITLRQHPFEPRMELAPLYLLGHFNLESAGIGFRVVAERPLEIGSWKEQGRPFYDRNVHYGFSVHSAGTVVVPSAGWRGSWLLASDGTTSRQVYPHQDLVFPMPSSGKLSLTVVGLPWNLLGPWHGRRDAMTKFTSPSHWEVPQAKVTAQMGADYDLLDLGLLESPHFFGTTG